MLRKTGILIGAVAMMTIVALAVGETASARGGPGSPRATLARNRAAARADARAMPAEIVLPTGAVALPAPSGPPPQITATTAGARVQARWRVPGESERQVIDEVESHRPADAIGTATESSGDAAGVTSLSVLYTLSDRRPAEIDERTLEVTAARGSGATIVTVESESVWVIPRSTASRIPSATRTVTLEVTAPDGRAVLARTLRATARVRSAVAGFNRLGAVQPFVISCPLSLPANRITVAFLGRAGTSPLALASYTYAFGGAAGECGAVALTVDGHGQDALVDPAYVRSLERIFGVAIPAGTERLRGPARS